MHTQSREISLPFRVDVNGGIAWTSNLVEIYRQRLVTLVLTELRERVMLPNYGVGLQQYLFENDDDVVLANLQVSLESAIRTWEPGLRITQVEPISTNPQDGLIGLVVSFRILEADHAQQTHAAFIEVGGTVREVIASG